MFTARHMICAQVMCVSPYPEGRRRRLSPIRANAFCPGATNTPMIHDNMDCEQVNALEKRIALGRLGEADEQARVVAFMLSDAASYLNGACLDSNGGSVML